MTKHPQWDVLGIGAAIIDYLVQVPTAFLTTVPGPRHGMQTITYDDFKTLLKRSGKIPRQVAGGSPANTIKGLAHLGHRCGLVTAIGLDHAAEVFRASLESSGIHLVPREKNLPTSQVLALIDESGHRTFRTFLGASSLLDDNDINPSHFEGVRLVHFSSYTLLNKGVLSKAMTIAKTAGAKVSLDLASHEMVSNHYTELMGLLRDHVDIVFSNEDEAQTLAKGGSVEHGCEILRNLCEVAVVSKGPHGCLVGSFAGTESFPAYPVTPLDTTGAGDFFASGFIHGYLAKRPIAECAHYGAVMGNAIVQVIGADLPSNTWNDIKKQLSFEAHK